MIVLVHSSDIHVDTAHVPPEYAGDGTAGLRAVLDAARAVDAHQAETLDPGGFVSPGSAPAA